MRKIINDFLNQGIPIDVFTSTLRTPEENAKVSTIGARSLHLVGRAVDVRVTNLTPASRAFLVETGKALNLDVVQKATHIHIENDKFVGKPVKTVAAVSAFSLLSLALGVVIAIAVTRSAT
jgi:hypothetical protein